VAPSTTAAVLSIIVHDWACFDYSGYLFRQEDLSGVDFTLSTTSWNQLQLVSFINKLSRLHWRPLQLVDNCPWIKLSHLYLFRLILHRLGYFLCNVHSLHRPCHAYSRLPARSTSVLFFHTAPIALVSSQRVLQYPGSVRLSWHLDSSVRLCNYACMWPSSLRNGLQ
jgi:hypothetical protein